MCNTENLPNSIRNYGKFSQILEINQIEIAQKNKKIPKQRNFSKSGHTAFTTLGEKLYLKHIQMGERWWSTFVEGD